MKDRRIVIRHSGVNQIIGRETACMITAEQLARCTLVRTGRSYLLYEPPTPERTDDLQSPGTDSPTAQ